MKKVIETELEVKKFFYIYLMVFIVAFAGISLVYKTNVVEVYNNSLDNYFYNIKVNLDYQYNEILIQSVGDADKIARAKDVYISFLEYFQENKDFLIYYSSGLLIVFIFVLVFIHMMIIEIYKKIKKLPSINITKMSKAFPILMFICLILPSILDKEEYYDLLKITDNIGIIIQFLLIVFGIIVINNLIETIQHKSKNFLKVLHIMLIIFLPYAYWFVGIFASIFNVRIIKKVGIKKYEL